MVPRRDLTPFFGQHVSCYVGCEMNPENPYNPKGPDLPDRDIRVPKDMAPLQ